MDTLAKIQNKLAPVVTSTADPQAKLLLQLRAIIARHDELKNLFLQFKKESRPIEWLRDMVVAQVVPYLDDSFDFSEVVEGCQYLSDEFNQLGETGYMVVSTETGKVEAVLSEDDLDTPTKISQITGEEIQGLTRIKVGTELALVTYKHETSREQEILDKLAVRGHQTQLLKEEGDSRLRMATRKGRKLIAEELGNDHPHVLLSRSGGTTGMFLRHVQVTAEPPSKSYDHVLEGTLSHSTQRHVQDALTLNLGHSQLGTLRGTVPQGWVRGLCRSLAEAAYQHYRGIALDIDELTKEDLKGVDLWVSDPDVFKEIRKVDPKIQVVPIEGVATIGLSGAVGVLEIPEEFTVHSQERFNRWEVIASVPYKFHIRWEGVSILPLVGVAHEATVEH